MNVKINNDIVEEIKDLFGDAENETFADGMNSVFGKKIQRIILHYGNASIEALDQALHSGHCNIEIAEEALRVVGNMTDGLTHDSRLEFLEYELKSANIRIRNAASIGLEALDDARAIPGIRTAIDCEKNQTLKTSLETVLEQLENNP